MEFHSLALATLRNPQPLFAQTHEWFRERDPLRELRAQVDVAYQGEQGVSPHGRAARLAGKFQKPLFDRLLPIG